MKVSVLKSGGCKVGVDTDKSKVCSKYRWFAECIGEVETCE